MFEWPFETHDIFVTLDDSKLYKLRSDFTKVVVDKEKVFDENGELKVLPAVILHKFQFDQAKGWLLDPNNPFRLKKEHVEMFYKVGFLSEEEVTEYVLRLGMD